MTMHEAHHPRDDIDSINVSRKEVGRGFGLVWFGFSFNGISIFVGYLMPKSFS